MEQKKQAIRSIVHQIVARIKKKLYYFFSAKIIFKNDKKRIYLKNVCQQRSIFKHLEFLNFYLSVGFLFFKNLINQLFLLKNV